MVAAALLVTATASVAAAPLKIETVVSPKQLIRLDFAGQPKHFVLMLQREGKAVGQGLLAGAAVTEYGTHDIMPGISGELRGYLVFALSQADIAYVQWEGRAVFVPGAGGKPRPLDHGIWKVVGATGKLKGLQGAGALRVERVSETQRRFILDGEVVPSAEAGGK